MARTDDAAHTFAQEALRRWQKLEQELRADVAEFNAHREDAIFSRPSDDQFHINNTSSGLGLTITADFDERVVRYDYAPVNSNTAGAPEGGVLSMRQCENGLVEFYSADERLTSEETRNVLLQPLLSRREAA